MQSLVRDYLASLAMTCYQQCLFFERNLLSVISYQKLLAGNAGTFLVITAELLKKGS